MFYLFLFKIVNHPAFQSFQTYLIRWKKTKIGIFSNSLKEGGRWLLKIAKVYFPAASFFLHLEVIINLNCILVCD